MPRYLSNSKQLHRQSRFALLLLSHLIFGLDAWALPLRSAYVTNGADDTVSVISLDTQQVVATIGVGDNPGYIALTPNGLRAYVTNLNSNNVSVIDTTLGTVIDTIPVGSTPLRPAISSDGQRVYVPNSDSATISVIDTTTNSVVGTVNTPPNPSSLALSPIHNELWVGYNNLGTVLDVRSTANLDTILASTITSAALYGSSDLVFREDGSELFGAEGCGLCGRFHRISGDISSGMIQILQSNFGMGHGSATGIAINPTSATVYLGKYGQSGTTPAVLEYGGQGRSLTFSAPVVDLAATGDGSRLYVVNDASSGFVSLVDTQTLMTIGSINVGAFPRGIAISEPNFNWAANASGNWSSASNWSLLSVPNNVEHDVTFGNAISSPITVNVDVDVALRSITFNNVNNGYTLKGDGTHSITLAANASIDVASGNHTISARLLGGAGGISKRGPGTLVLSGTTIFQNNIMQVDAGTLEIAGGGTLSADGRVGYPTSSIGAVIVDGATSAWSASALEVGYSGSGAVTVRSGGFVATDFIATVGEAPGGDGTVTVDGPGSGWTYSGTSYAVIGGFGTGRLRVINGGHVSTTRASVGQQTGGNGQVTVDGMGSLWTSGALEIGRLGNGSLAVQNHGKVSSSGALIGASGALTFGGNGMVSVDGAGSEWENSSSLYVGAHGAGALTVTGGGKVSNTIGVVAFVPGDVGSVTVEDLGSTWMMTGQLGIGGNPATDNSGGTALVTVGTGGAVNVGVTTTVFPGGSLKLQGGSFTTPTLTNRGVVDVGGTLTATGGVTMTGTGVLKGTGTIVGNLTSSGRVAPGNSPGIINITGNYTQNSDGVLEIEVGGPTAGTQHDKLVVSGTAALDGRLEAPMLRGPGYVAPFAGEEITFLHADGGVTGNFSSFSYPHLDDPSFNPNGLAIVASPVAPGSKDVKLSFVAPSSGIHFDSDSATATWADTSNLLNPVWTTNTVPTGGNIVTVDNNLINQNQRVDVKDVQNVPNTGNAQVHILVVESGNPNTITVGVQSGHSLSASVGATVGDKGIIELNNGSLVSPTVEIQSGGSLAGNGTVVGKLVVGAAGGATNAMLSPGISADPEMPALTVQGDYHQGTNGVFMEKVTGTGAGQFATTQVSGTAQLGGTLRIDLSELPNDTTQSFHITYLTAGSLSGSVFQNVETVGNSGFVFLPSYESGSAAGAAALSGSGSATAGAGASGDEWPLGDVSGNRKAGPEDITAFAYALGNRTLLRKTFPAYKLRMGDVNGWSENILNTNVGGDGVDFSDIPYFIRVMNHWHVQASSASLMAAIQAAELGVPEPSSATLILFGGCFLLTRIGRVATRHR